MRCTSKRWGFIYQCKGKNLYRHDSYGTKFCVLKQRCREMQEVPRVKRSLSEVPEPKAKQACLCLHAAADASAVSSAAATAILSDGKGNTDAYIPLGGPQAGTHPLTPPPPPPPQEMHFWGGRMRPAPRSRRRPSPPPSPPGRRASRSGEGTVRQLRRKLVADARWQIPEEQLPASSQTESNDTPVETPRTFSNITAEVGVWKLLGLLSSQNGFMVRRFTK